MSNMKTSTILIASMFAAACSQRPEHTVTLTPTANRKLFIDVHNVGPGKVTAQAVAEAHKKDLATEGKYGVDYKAYFFDEKEGKIYCLVEAPDANSALAVHKEAHGLMPDSIEEVAANQ